MPAAIRPPLLLLSLVLCFSPLLLLPNCHSLPLRPTTQTLIIDIGPSSSRIPAPQPPAQSDEQQQQQKPSVPPVLDELSSHFAGLDGPAVAKLGEQLQRIKRLAHQMAGYGHRRFHHDTVTDRQKPVQISAAHPPSSAELAQLLFEGDILLTDRQLGSLLAHLEESSAQRVPAKRSLSADPAALWPRMPIRFRLHESLELTAVQQIVEAIAYVENSSCIRFEHLERDIGQNDTEEDFVEFFKGQGCYSMIGRFGGRQGVSIGPGCERVGIVEHELGHVLGLWHEQSRPDAWKYVRVEKAFIMPSYMADFQLRGADEILTLGLPYDYGSVMHYGPTAFSADGTSVTLMTKNALFQSTIGQRDRLAFYDLMSINKAYCADMCGGIPELFAAGFGPAKVSLYPSADDNDIRQPVAAEPRVKCQNGGYPNPGRCQECICPTGYGGKRCEKPQAAKKANCGGKLLVDFDRWTELESPGYSGDGYEPGQHCNWLIRSPANSRIQAEFLDDFALLCATICLDYVELKLAKDQRLTGARFCCNRKPEGTFVSEHNQMAILFRAQLAQDIGFRLRLRATKLSATSQRTGKNSVEGSSEAGNKKAMLLPGKDIWSAWGVWSACSRPCGGCGIRSRIRTCLSAECPNGKAQEFSACNFQACPVKPNCQKVLYLNRLCHSALSDSPAICSQLSHQLSQCNEPSCCPPFYALKGKCVTDEFDQEAAIGQI